MNEPKQQQPQHYDPGQDEGRVVEQSNLALLQSGEIDQQIATAHRFPRSLTTFRQRVLEQVTLDPVIAGKCIYALPRDGKVIEGPSVRFAEIIAASWGNNRHGARVVDIGAEFVTAQGFFHDLENNMAVTFEVLRRITNKRGERFGQDMIGVTGNAAASIALRNAVTRGIPQAFWADHLDAARRVVAGDVKTLVVRRQNMMKEFVIFGIKPEQIFGLIGVKGIEDLTIENLVTLAGLHTAIKDGDTSPEEAFAPDKMRVPGEAVPPRPTKSEFDRKIEPEKTAAPKEPEKVEPKPESTAAQASTGGAEQGAKPAVAETVDDRAERRRKDWADQLAAWEGELRALTKVREVGEKRDMVDEQIDDPAEKKLWGEMCDAQTAAILEKTRKAAPKK